MMATSQKGSASVLHNLPFSVFCRSLKLWFEFELLALRVRFQLGNLQSFCPDEHTFSFC